MWWIGSCKNERTTVNEDLKDDEGKQKDEGRRVINPPGLQRTSNGRVPIQISLPVLRNAAHVIAY